MSDNLHTPKIARLFVGFIQKRPLVSLILGILLVLVLIPGLGRLQPDFTYRGFFYDSDKLLQEFPSVRARVW